MLAPPLRPPRRPPPMPTAKSVHFPAPVGGLNSIAGGSDMPITDGTLIYNMIASQSGLRLRPAFTLFRGNIDGTSASEMRSIIPFTGSKADASTDKLFAATKAGVWDITSASSQVATYGTQTGDAGYGASLVFNTSADRYLIVCDEVNGYWIRPESTGTWAQVTLGVGAGQVSVGDPTKFVHVTAFKNRLWFTQKDSTLGWYLGTNAVYGAATSFDFGPRFKAGGDLRGLFNWSYDGGNGIDTLLVAISGGGDAAIYQGVDPATAAGFGLKGTWNVSGVPAGRRIATDYGGDLLILSTTGVIPLSRLVIGNSDLELSQYSTYKIANLFAKAMASYSSNKGWAIQLNPSDNSLLINVPTADGTYVAFQFVMSLATKAWSQYGHDTSTTCYGYPMLSSGIWQNTLYFGRNTSQVMKLTKLSDTTQTDVIGTIEYEVVSSFQDLGSPRQKRILEIRPRFLTYMDQTTSRFAELFSAAARYNYDATELTAITGFAGSLTPAATASPTAYQPIFGATGIGPSVAIAVRGKASCQTTLVGFDVVYDEGGFQ